MKRRSKGGAGADAEASALARWEDDGGRPYPDAGPSRAVTEEEFLAAVENAVRILAPKFTFGIYDVDDVKQEARMEAWSALAQYDPSRGPIDNLIYVHVRNRLMNLVRNKCRRNDPPCLVCHEADGGRTEHAHGGYCPVYVAWRTRNDTKASIQHPLRMDAVSDEGEASLRDDSDVERDAEMREILGMIDRELPVELRASYLMMRAGKSVPKARRAQVEEAVRGIVGDVF